MKEARTNEAQHEKVPFERSWTSNFVFLVRAEQVWGILKWYFVTSMGTASQGRIIDFHIDQMQPSAFIEVKIEKSCKWYVLSINQFAVGVCCCGLHLVSLQKSMSKVHLLSQVQGWDNLQWKFKVIVIGLAGIFRKQGQCRVAPNEFY